VSRDEDNTFSLWEKPPEVVTYGQIRVLRADSMYLIHKCSYNEFVSFYGDKFVPKPGTFVKLQVEAVESKGEKSGWHGCWYPSSGWD